MRETDATRELAERARRASDAALLRFFGPWMFGFLALAARNPAERAAALAEGQALLAAGTPCHNHIAFGTIAIEISLDGAEWDEAERYADALEAYYSAEPLPLIDATVERGRLLARLGRGERSPTLYEAIGTLAARLGVAQKPLAHRLNAALDASLTHDHAGIARMYPESSAPSSAAKPTIN